MLEFICLEARSIREVVAHFETIGYIFYLENLRSSRTALQDLPTVSFSKPSKPLVGDLRSLEECSDGVAVGHVPSDSVTLASIAFITCVEV